VCPSYSGLVLYQVADRGKPPMWMVTKNTLNKQLRTADRWLSSELWLGEILTVKLALLQNMNFGLAFGFILCYEISHEKWDIKFGTWNIMSLYTAGSLTAADMKIVRCNLNLACTQEVSWDKGSTVRARYNFFL